ncbi:fungal specific transcription factor domain-containing protein [Aspergillus clavatus NRRL 1]|uniref:C6 finger domain protein, putative n=1 Tax=Aspergillus clavatus (strain ATCC 1007 / CBS 513.65 / DSM 816 / NCTC 3887 / NRRL 1 / QM 1276 / 107) TaxID=344612 RepID=A1CQ48_ASPCL|nr:C6 finger domain protein, putative [Aspergillus clavatus NRRL 1]EAW07769.1 C6 finger domain protein, putative [Aspergillus clavatus NRRL 1]
MQLQWGGRTFSRSRLGACMGNGGLQKLEYSPGEFIYTTKLPTTVSSPALPRPIDPFSSLSPEQKSLLHHFIQDASQITACHSGMQKDICKMLLPMALQTPSLLYATMALSAIHLQAVNNQSENVKSAPDIARSMALSLEHFRKELQDPSTRGSDALLATARTLCLAEIHSGAIHPNSWQAHMEGAKALMLATNRRGGESPGSSQGFRRYLDRWYQSIVSLTALTGNGPPIEEATHCPSRDITAPDYLDDYWGFTVNLSQIFRAIGAAAWRSHHLQNSGIIEKDTPSLSNEATILESSVRTLMAQNASAHPTFYPGVGEGLSNECIREFMLCNEAFQHSALIQIHRRLRKTLTASPLVQHSVKRILECTIQIGPSAGLSPWTMLTTPLFIAGCEARGEDREMVRQLLSLLHNTIRVPNVLQSMKFLEQYWANQLNEDEGWSHYLGLERMRFDFIPY